MATSFYNLPTLSTSPNTHFLLFYFLSSCLLPSANSVDFLIPHFDANVTNILCQGDAVATAGAVELTKDYPFRVGGATYVERVPLWDPNTKELADFSTRFSFSIDTQGHYPHADGFAFFLAPVGFQMPPNSAGGYFGLFNTTTVNSSTNQIIFVEFDSYGNYNWDPDYDHVGININSITSAIITPWNASLHSGDTADAWITYNAATKNLSVSWTYKTTYSSQEKSSLSYPIDLMKVLPEWVTVGFSAATGREEYLERHRLQSWEFRSSLNITEKGDGKNAKKIKLVVGLTVSFGILIAGGIIASVILWTRRPMKVRRVEAINLKSIDVDFEMGAGPRSFHYEDLVSATDNFSIKRILGAGGFGEVYRGYLNDLGKEVAVKKISRGSKQGKKEYVAEVMTIGRLRHRNLVQLIGWCHDRGDFLLVYEFMPNGSLNTHLFGKKSPLTWAVRYKIAHGLASALLYIHEDCEPFVVHRDIKSSNIMLDSSFNVKLGDFGLARLMDHELGSQTTELVGTPGYMAPEYINTGKASKESDVFSFGVVALEIATGRRSVDQMGVEYSQMGLVEWVWDLYGRGNLLLAVDERLHIDYNQKEVQCLMIVGLWCAHPDRSLRPPIRQAIQVLNFQEVKPNLPSKLPVPIYQVPMPTVNSREPSITYTSINVGR